MPKPPASASAELYGRLKEGLHLTAYSFERAGRHLLTLLEGEAWQLDGRFDNVNAFMDSLQLGGLKHTIEQRTKIEARIKELQPKISNRQIAKTLGVNEKTVRRDTAANAAPSEKNTKENKEPEPAAAANAARKEIAGDRAANLVLRRETASQDRRDKVAADEARILTLKPREGKFRTLVIDPAWEYDWLSIAGRAKPGYAMQTHEQLLALDVKAWAHEQCHLYVWATNNFMQRAEELVKHWGFQHRVLLTWIKPPPFGLGSYFRNSTEHVIFATLGDTTTRQSAASIATHFEAPRGEHSEKPEKFYEIVRAASYPPYGEANQRQPRPDFIDLYCPVTEGESPQEAAE